MRAMFMFEWKLFWRNIKNVVTFAVFIFLSLYLALAVEPNDRPNRSIEYDEIAATNRDANYFIENRDPAIYERTIPMFSELADTSEALLDALETEDYQAVMELENTYYMQNLQRFSNQDPNYYAYGVPVDERHQMMTYDNTATTNHYNYLSDGNFVLSLEIIEGQTALQAFARQFKGLLPLALILLVVTYGIDIFAEDNQHHTIVGELPLTKYKRLWVKTLVVVLAVLLSLFVGSLLFMLITGFRTGFGGLNLPVPHILHNLPIGQYLMQVFVLILLIALVFSRGMAWISLFINKSAINLLFIPLIFIGGLWHESGIAYSHPEIAFFPPTYFRVGDVVSGYLNFWYSSDSITFGTGVVVLLGLLIIIELLHLLIIRAQRN